jgi:aldehyde dehydrogenase (NAD+)
MSKSYIDGEWVEGDGKEFDSINPSNEEVIDTFKENSSEQVIKAIKSADEAFEEWKNLSRINRAEYLWEIYNIIKDNKDELSELVSRECGKEINEGEADIVEASHMVELAAGNSRNPSGEIVPSEIPEKDSYMRRKPRGVVGCITPWNFPVAIPFWHIAISLVEGNTVVLKPSEVTPKCGEKIAEMFDEVGIPDGVFNLVHGREVPGQEIVQNPDVDTVVFTGSSEVGQKISMEVSEQFGKNCTCEMGGKNSILVTDKADIDTAIHCSIMSAFKTTGQRCVSAGRIVVHESLYDEFKERFIEIANQLEIGDPLDNPFMGPMASKKQLDNVLEDNEKAVEQGAEVLLDKEVTKDDGFWTGPFVYEINKDADILNTEVFGPHVALIEYSGDIEDGIRICNDSDYGLAGSIVTEDYRQMNKYRDNIEVGLAYANLPCIGAEVQLPFGGLGKSGDGLPYAREIIETVTHRTAWTVNNDEDIEMSQGLSTDIKTED